MKLSSEVDRLIILQFKNVRVYVNVPKYRFALSVRELLSFCVNTEVGGEVDITYS